MKGPFEGTQGSCLQENDHSNIRNNRGVMPYIYTEKTLQRMEELISFIDAHFTLRDSKRQFSEDRWNYVASLCMEMERLIPETMRGVSQGGGIAQYKNSTCLEQLRTQLLKIVSKNRSISQMAEKRMIIDALKKTDQNHKKAAELLGISHRTLRNKIKEYDLQSSASYAISDLGSTSKFFSIKPDVIGHIYFQRDNSYLWSGTQSLTGRELCIHGPSNVLYHREVFEWISDQVVDLIDATKVVLREDEGLFTADHYFEIVARRVVGIIELDVVDLPEVFRIGGHTYRVFFRFDLLPSFRVRFPAALVIFDYMSQVIL
jgi:hypothetical protein